MSERIGMAGLPVATRVIVIDPVPPHHVRGLAGRKACAHGAGPVQIAIVLASAQIITGGAALVWIAGAPGLVGVAFSLIALLAPTAVHLF